MDCIYLVCPIILMGIHGSSNKQIGIVTLLFCGITLKHYAYYNMSRRTQLTTKYLFQVLAQLSENFIFIYLGLSLFTDTQLEFKPIFIFVTVFGICAARWMAVFPLSKLVNWFIRYRARRRGVAESADELPYNYQAMLFWAGLRGAVGVALAAGLMSTNAASLKATVLVVVVLTVIIFGGTTARMLEILNIRTGVVEEIDSDDEFDIEAVPHANGTSYYKRSGTGVGNDPRWNRGGVAVPLDVVNRERERSGSGYASGNARSPVRPENLSRKGSASSANGKQLHPHASEEDLLGRIVSNSDDEFGSDLDDLPPQAKQSSRRSPRPPGDGAGDAGEGGSYPTSGQSGRGNGHNAATGAALSAGRAISSLFSGTAEDHAAWFQQLDEGFIKPTLLLDGGKGPHGGQGGSLN
jgi:sodium/hydrogen exchanger-like protein 6/7